MNAKMNRRKAEINDAALEGVSGGGRVEERARAESFAGDMCRRCQKELTATESREHVKMLAKYMLEHGLTSVKSPNVCPYLKN